jgi:hypothetical protein
MDMTETEARIDSNRILSAVMARRTAAGFAFRITFSDRAEPYTEYCRNIDERNARMAKARLLTTAKSVEIVTG